MLKYGAKTKSYRTVEHAQSSAHSAGWEVRRGAPLDQPRTHAR